MWPDGGQCPSGFRSPTGVNGYRLAGKRRLALATTSGPVTATLGKRPRTPAREATNGAKMLQVKREPPPDNRSGGRIDSRCPLAATSLPDDRADGVSIAQRRLRPRRRRGGVLGGCAPSGQTNTIPGSTAYMSSLSTMSQRPSAGDRHAPAENPRSVNDASPDSAVSGGMKAGWA
jgi:hypothetical protein